MNRRDFAKTAGAASMAFAFMPVDALTRLAPQPATVGLLNNAELHAFVDSPICISAPDVETWDRWLVETARSFGPPPWKTWPSREAVTVFTFLALYITLCGSKVEYHTVDDVPRHSVPCPCGNPRHWFIKIGDGSDA
jgi:hypothetical protein